MSAPVDGDKGRLFLCHCFWQEGTAPLPKWGALLLRRIWKGLSEEVWRPPLDVCHCDGSSGGSESRADSDRDRASL
jgi:hypothetical protein